MAGIFSALFGPKRNKPKEQGEPDKRTEGSTPAPKVWVAQAPPDIDEPIENTVEPVELEEETWQQKAANDEDEEKITAENLAPPLQTAANSIEDSAGEVMACKEETCEATVCAEAEIETGTEPVEGEFKIGMDIEPEVVAFKPRVVYYAKEDAATQEKVSAAIEALVEMMEKDVKETELLEEKTLVEEEKTELNTAATPEAEMYVEEP